jgi:hypothetical protein
MDHVALDKLQAGLDEIRLSPRDAGRIELIVRRPATNEREVLAEAELDDGRGMVGDYWSGSEDTENPKTQLTLMNARAAALIAGPRERWGLAGDQLYVDLDLSYDNLPPGTRLSIGSAVIEITAEPHLGCGKFVARFGVDAAKFVNSAAGRELNLRGINARVLVGGVVRSGDLIAKG